MENEDKQWGRLRKINIIIRIAVVLLAIIAAIWLKMSR